MNVVLDASAAIEVALKRPHAPRFIVALRNSQVVFAPDLIFAEVAQTFWKLHRFDGLKVAACNQGIEDALGLVDVATPCGSLVRDAFLLARTEERSAYDMFYLALARREAGVLATLDSGLRSLAERQGVAVV